MSLFGLKSKIEKSSINPEVSSVLQTVWIKIHKVPGLARDVETIKEITSLVAEPLVVDELSLVRDEPVRVKGRCRNPAAIRGYIEYFFNGEGVNLKFEVENSQGGYKKGKGPPGPPGPGKPDDARDKDTGNNQKGDKGRRFSSKFDRMGGLDKEMDTYHDDSMEEAMETEVPSNSNDQQSGENIPIAAFHPNLGILELGDEQVSDRKEDSGSPYAPLSVVGDPSSVFMLKDKIEQEEKSETGLVPSDSQIIVHGAEGPYLMDKIKWPTLKGAVEGLEDSPIESLTQEEYMPPQGFESNKMAAAIYSSPKLAEGVVEADQAGEDLMDSISCQSKDSDLEEVDHGWKTSRSKKSKKHKKNRVVVASRTSSRIPRDGIPIAEKATKRAMEKNNIVGITTTNPFTVLNNTSNVALHSVISDLDIDIDNVEEQLDVFRLEELARAAIAEANYKSYLESQKNKDGPQNEEEISELAMEAISNKDREGSEIFSMGGENSDCSDTVTKVSLLSEIT
jgi:hypothetical protein